MMGPNLLCAWVNISQPNELSIRALGSIAIAQRDVPGHKVVVWIGQGWPVNGGDVGFDEATELSTRLREARITLDSINVWPNLFHHSILTTTSKRPGRKRTCNRPDWHCR